MAEIAEEIICHEFWRNMLVYLQTHLLMQAIASENKQMLTTKQTLIQLVFMVNISRAQRVFKIPLVLFAFAITLKGINTLRG